MKQYLFKNQPAVKINVKKVIIGALGMLALFSFNGLVLSKTNLAFAHDGEDSESLQRPANETVHDAMQTVKSTTIHALELASQLDKTKDRYLSNAVLDKLTKAVEVREKALIELMKDDPSSVLKVALSDDLRSSFPAVIQNHIEKAVALTGIIGISITGDWGTEGFKETYLLTTDNGQDIQLHLAVEFPLPVGAKVEIRGFQIQNHLLVAAKEDITILEGDVSEKETSVKEIKTVFATLSQHLSNYFDPPAFAATTVKTIVGLAYKFQSDPDCYAGVCPAIYTLDYRLRLPIFTDPLSTRQYFLESSFGQLVLNGKTSEQGDVFGTYVIPDSTPCSTSSILSAVKAAASAQGVDLSNYNYYVLLGYAGGACAINGYSGNTYISQGSITPGGNLAHEMGHMFGVSHVNGYMCMDDATTNRVPISNHCAVDTYGTGLDVMGGVNEKTHLGHMVEYHKNRLNWLPSANIQTVTADGVYTFAPIEQLTSGPMAIRIARKKSSTGAVTQWYSLEYHQPSGNFEGHFAATDPHFTGIMVHLIGGFADVGMLDMEPEGLTGTYTKSDGTTGYVALLETGFDNYTLKLNKTFTDPLSGVSITPTSLTPSGATVQVTFGPGTCVRGNPTLTVSPTTQWGYAGVAKTYNLTLTNTDSSWCSSSDFNLVPTVPTGWTVDPATLSANIGPGASTTPSMTVTPPPTASDGFYDFQLTATNLADTTSHATAVATYVVQPPDTTPPTVTITKPTDGSVLKGTKITIQASVSDGSGVASIELFIDSVSKKVCSNTTTCSYSGSSSGLILGTHTIQATAIDKSPNANTASVSITVTKK